MEHGNMPPPISVTINTLLGGAFLLEVDPMTRVAQVKDMLSQMQGIPVRQQSLIYKQKVLPDEACLHQCGIRDGATMSLVLRVSSALTNVMVNEPTMEADSMMAECFGVDFDSMDFLDVTGLDELEQDELLSMLFGPSDDGSNRPQTFVLCRDGDKINVLQLGSGGAMDPSQLPPGAALDDQQPPPHTHHHHRNHHSSSGDGGYSHHHGNARSPGASRRLADSPSALGGDGVPLQDRIRRFEENARHRKSMADLMARMRERKGNRHAKGKMFGNRINVDRPIQEIPATSEAGPAVLPPSAASTLTSSVRTLAQNDVSGISPPLEFPVPPHRASASSTVAPRNGLLPSIGATPGTGTGAQRRHGRGIEATPERRHLSSAGGSEGHRRQFGEPTSAKRRLVPRNLGPAFACADGERVLSATAAGCRAHSALSFTDSARSARSGSRAPMPPQTLGDGFRTPPTATATPPRLHLPALSPRVVGVINPGGSHGGTPQKPTPFPEPSTGNSHLANGGTTPTPLCPVAAALTAPAAPTKTKKRTRCAHCNRKIKLATSFHCRCDKHFCGQHRYAETHSCTFDYKSAGRKMLEAAAPSIAAPKLPKI